MSSQAYDAESGDGPLWSFQTGAGANSTVTVFEQDGTQYLAFLAGGNALAATKHGDNLWLFSLEGTMDEVASGGEGEGTGHAGEVPAEPTSGGRRRRQGRLGRQLRRLPRPRRHGRQRRPEPRRKPERIRSGQGTAQVTDGGGGMPAFKDTLTQQQIDDVAAYVSQDIAEK